MNAYEPAAAYHRLVRLRNQISNHRLNYNIITHRNTSLGSLIWSNPEPLISKQNVYSLSEIQNRSVFYRTGGIPNSKYYCYIAQPSMLCHNSGKLITVFVRKKWSSHSSQRDRCPKLLHIP